MTEAGKQGEKTNHIKKRKSVHCFALELPDQFLTTDVTLFFAVFESHTLYIVLNYSFATLCVDLQLSLCLFCIGKRQSIYPWSLKEKIRCAGTGTGTLAKTSTLTQLLSPQLPPVPGGTDYKRVLFHNQFRGHTSSLPVSVNPFSERLGGTAPCGEHHDLGEALS